MKSYKRCYFTISRNFLRISSDRCFKKNFLLIRTASAPSDTRLTLVHVIIWLNATCTSPWERKVFNNMKGWEIIMILEKFFLSAQSMERYIWVFFSLNFFWQETKKQTIEDSRISWSFGTEYFWRYWLYTIYCKDDIVCYNWRFIKVLPICRYKYRQVYVCKYIGLCWSRCVSTSFIALRWWT